MTTETAEYQQVSSSEVPLNPEPETTETRVVRGRPFEPGVSGNPAGRPRKGQTLPERLRVELDRRAPKIIDGQLSAAERGNTRAFVAAMSYAYGVPATKLVIEQADSPASELLLRMLASGGINPRSQALLTQSSQDSHTHTSNTDPTD